MCKALLVDVRRFVRDNEGCIGFGFCGDGNCNLPQWTPAFPELPQYVLTAFVQRFLKGMGQKTGDLMVCCGVRGLSFSDNTCQVPNRDKQHDCMIMEWSYEVPAPS